MHDARLAEIAENAAERIETRVRDGFVEVRRRPET